MTYKIVLISGYSFIIAVFAIRIIYDFIKKRYSSMMLFTILVLLMTFLVSKVIKI